MTQSKDKALSEDEISLSKETAIVNREISLDHNSLKGGSRISPSSTNQCRGPEGLSVVPGNVPRSFASADMYCSEIKLGEVLKIS